MTGLEPSAETAEDYRRWAQLQAAGRSPAYERLAKAVSGDESVLAFLSGLPAEKRLPNLLFAAATYLLGVPVEIDSLYGLVRDRADDLAAVMRARRTQTNEAARCAILLPALVALPGPLALLEVGAAAGLTLLPDRYSYDYDGHRLTGVDPLAPTLRCQPRGPMPLPTHLPTVAWRAGIDINPLNADDADDGRWLECMLWPGETGRKERLRGALAAARRCKPPVYRGDLLDDLARVASLAPPDATLVVYHSATLVYVEEPKRRAFAAAVANLGAVWLSNEGEHVLPDLDLDHHVGSLVLVHDGNEVLAHADPHGAWVEWTRRDTVR
jgi:hypothetical protein